METLRNSLINRFYFAAGIAILIAAKVKYSLRGYKTPRLFSESDVESALRHDVHVVDDWKQHLARWHGSSEFVAGADVLELGPGGDLGIPLLLVGQHDARSYSALDVYDLARAPRMELYRALRRRILAERPGQARKVDEAMDAIGRVLVGEDSRLVNYRLRDDFDLVKAFAPRKFNVFLSNAAFEHFDDPLRVLEQVTELAAPDARLCFGIDFKTHSAWIRDKDPLNIYRYSPGLYKRLTYRGSPNRYLLYQYLEQLERLGWRDIAAYRDYTAPHFDSTIRHLHRSYRHGDARYTWVVICARR